LLRQSAICKANGMGSITDAVLAHRDGGANSRYEFPTPSGASCVMPLDKTCFVNEDPRRGPVIHKDHVAVPTEDFAYLSANNSVTSPATTRTVMARMDRLSAARSQEGHALRQESVGFDGMRIDNIKSMDPGVIRQIQAATGLWAVSAKDWSSNLDQMTCCCSAPTGWPLLLYDYPLFFELRNMM